MSESELVAKHTLFIGITTWSSAQFIGHCLHHIKSTTKVDHQICVLDNCSDDSTADIVLRFDCDLIQKKCSQSDALNTLLSRSTAEYTLLIHADTILLSDRWFDLVASKLTDQIILVSPEDIGCGPMTRDFGRNMPESSFLFFRTQPAKRVRHWRIRRRRFMLPMEVRKDFPFHSDHITHGIPAHLSSHGLSWSPMTVHASKRLNAPWYVPVHRTLHWQDELAHLQYGLGNFYSLDGHITHYHNWYDRIQVHGNLKNSQSTGRDKTGFPTDFINAYTRKFLKDIKADHVSIPALANDD